MKTLGITGGIGMGKSTTAELLRRRGVAVVDTDDLARKVVEPGEPALAQVRAEFGAKVFSEDGQLDREALAKIVFGDDGARKKLEAILHPRILGLWREQLQAWREEDRPVAAVVIPLLFETQAEKEFDSVVCVACSAATQHARLIARGMDAVQIRHRIAAQMPVEEKVTRSDHVIWTEGALDAHAEQLKRVLSLETKPVSPAAASG